ncbi:phasin family protein [Legionella brunensis]|uniref:Phasin protein n=1 Tax=Legionella brunensis TaxID=29422 RepID=A0A0W0S090_9GAMM|nr:hypothetical protein Lbru_3002 [Legionella brunensis]
MNPRYLEQWTEIARHIQRPFQAMLELNVRTLKGFNFLKAEDLVNIKKPEELVEKQVNLVIENGHKALDYLQQSFAIFEQTLQPLTEDAKKSSQSTSTTQSLKSLLNPTKLAMVPTKAAIDWAKPLLDPMLSGLEPSKTMLELANFSFDSNSKSRAGSKESKIKKN